MKRSYIALVILSWACTTAVAAANSSGVYLEPANTKITDIESLRRGAELFSKNCQSCHSAEFISYSRIAKDLKWDSAEIRKIMSVNGSVHSTIASPLSKKDGEMAYGVAPPDLSLRARVRGNDWIFNFLKGFYLDESKNTGYNNIVFDGVAMPPSLLVNMQGKQQAVYRKVAGEDQMIALQQVSEGTMSKREFHRSMQDLTNFLDYIAEPSKIQRVKLGWKVMLFIFVLIILTYMLKNEYWKAVNIKRK